MSAPKILGLKKSEYWGMGDATRYPNQPRNVKPMLVWSQPTGKVTLVKANLKG